MDLIGTWLGLGLGVFGTKGLGTGLDNSEMMKSPDTQTYTQPFRVLRIGFAPVAEVLYHLLKELPEDNKFDYLNRIENNINTVHIAPEPRNNEE